MEVPTIIPVGERFTGNACTRCSHRPVGTVVMHQQGNEVVDWHDAPDCGCVCHDAWRIVHGVYPSLLPRMEPA